MRLPLAMIALCGLWVFTGCRAGQLGADQAEMRDTLLDLYTDQIMDNLTRIRSRLPIIHLDYSKATGTVTQMVGAEGGATNTVAKNGFRLLPGAAPAANAVFQTSKVDTDVLNWKASGSQQNQLTVTADPVITNNDVYDAYLQFMAIDGSLVGPRSRVPCGDVNPDAPDAPHIVHKFKGQYYWVPKKHADDFFRLSLMTTAMRGTAVLRPGAFKVTIAGVLTDTPIPAAAGATPGRRLRIQLKDKVPNDSGELIVFIKGQQVKLTLEAVQEVDGKRVELNKPIDVVDVIVDPKELAGELKPADVKEGLKDAEALIKLTHNQPGSTKTDDALDAIRHQLELQRLNTMTR